MKVSVLESGGWGTAIAVALCGNGHDVTLHSIYENRSEEYRQKRENSYLPGVVLPEKLNFSDTFEGLDKAEAVVFVPPSFALRSVARSVRGIIDENAVLISASKGIESGTSMRLSQIIGQEMGGGYRLAAISGPSHAEEVGRGVPTGLVAASADEETAKFVQDLFMSHIMRVYTSSDIVGTELCGALKNIIALCAGICDGLGYGDNTIAMLMTRGIAEITALGVAMGGKRETFAGLAGVGDLIVTCTSMHSRNRRAGVYIGQGMNAQDAMKKVGATVEGYYAAKSAKELADRLGVEMPISAQAYSVLYEDKLAASVVSELMGRSKKEEAWR